MESMNAKLAVKALAALAHDRRLAVFRLLVTAGPKGMSPGTIAEQIGLPAPTLSFHLKELSQAGLIDGHNQGRNIFYSANYACMNSLVSFLMENCCAAGRVCSTTPIDAEA